MSRIKLLLNVAEDMRSLADSLQVLADSILQGGDWEREEPVDMPDPAPPETPAITLEEVRSVLGQKSREGYTDAVRGLLKQFGATRLSEVDPKDYADLKRAAEELDHAT